MSKDINWFISFRSPQEIWRDHPSFLVEELVFYVCELLTLIHALRNGGRYKYLWIATVFHGLVVESLSYFLPDIDNFWHAQTMVMLLGKRLPLHIIFLYPVFIYTAACAVSRLHLRAWAEPFAVGLSAVLLDVPFDIVGIRTLSWTWHDTDPNIYDRHYHVPWTSYYFHAAFASAFMILFNGTRALIGHGGSAATKMESDGFFKEMLCSLVTGMLAMPLGIVQFLPVYHPLHDSHGIHTETCVLILVAVYVMIVWTSDRRPVGVARQSSIFRFFDELGLLVLIHFSTYILMSIYVRTEAIRSTGLHELTGPCNETEPVDTAFGHVLSRRKYLCTTDHNEPFDFHCMSGGKKPSDGSSWYTICGTPVENYVEYVLVVCAFSALGLYVFLQMLAFSGPPLRGYASPSYVKGKAQKKSD